MEKSTTWAYGSARAISLVGRVVCGFFSLIRPEYAYYQNLRRNNAGIQKPPTKQPQSKIPPSSSWKNSPQYLFLLKPPFSYLLLP